MKKIILLLITIFCISYLATCGGASNDAANADGNKEIVSNSDDEPVVTEATEVEPEVTPAPADEPTTEPTPVPTEEPTPTPAPTENPYTGIDMKSDLNGIEWIETFVGVIAEPKVVVYSDITGRKQIVEEGDKVFINPEEDIIAVYLPEGYKYASKTAGIYKTSLIDGDHSLSCVLDVEKTVEKKFHKAGMFVEYAGEEIEIGFTIQTQE